MWVEEYEGDLADIFGIQASIASRIAEALQVQLSPAEEARMAGPATASPAATAAYLRAYTTSGIAGLLAPSGAVRGMPFVEEALRINPMFAQAHAKERSFIPFSERMLRRLKLRIRLWHWTRTFQTDTRHSAEPIRAVGAGA